METINITDTLPIKDKNSNIQIEDNNSITEESIFENAIPLSKDKEDELISDELIFENTEAKDEVETKDFFDNYNKILEEQKIENKRIESSIKDEDIFANVDEVEEPSTWDKMMYGWDKNDMVFGDLILRIPKNYIDSIFDSDKTVEEAAVENAKEEEDAFNKKYWKFKSGKYDGAYSAIGAGATYILDPYYLAGYYFGAAALASPVSSAFLNAALLGGDNLIHQLAKKGKVTSWGEVATSAGVGAGIGLVLPYGGKIIKKYLPSGIKNKAAEISKFIDSKVAEKNGMSIAELAIVRNAANKEPIKKITKQIDELVTSPSFISKGNNFYSPLVNAKNTYDTLRSKLAKEIKDIRQIKSLTKKTKWGSEKFKIEALKSQGKKILDIKIKGKVAKDVFIKEKDRLTKRALEKINKLNTLENKRITALLAEVKNKHNIGEKVLTAMLANLTKPLMGAMAGGAANVGFGLMGHDVEDDLAIWMGIGFALGGSLRAISQSKLIPLAQKDIYGKIIKNTGTKFALQKIREWTAGTLATKLDSFGGTTQKIGKLLFRGIDDPMTSKSTNANAAALEKYFIKKATAIIEGSTPEEHFAAVTINRGNKVVKDSASPKVLKLATDIKNFTDEISLLASKAGFKGQNIDDYFPRVLDWDMINKDFPKALKVFTSIFKKNYNLTDKRAAKAAETYLASGSEQAPSVINDIAWKKIISGMKIGDNKVFAAASDDLIITPMSEHITNKRILQGPYKIVEEVLEKNNYLINDLGHILPNIIENSVKSIAFARTFGKNGQLLKPLLQEIKQKYDDLILSDTNAAGNLLKIGNTKWTKLAEAEHETRLVLNAVDAYFGRYTGYGNAGQGKSVVGLLTMLSNLNMLGKVTISSLGDIVQIFQHSENFSSAIKGMVRTNIMAKYEKGLARDLNIHITNEMSKSVARTAASAEEQLILTNKWMGNWGVKDIANPNLYNNLAFKGLGLEWLTGYARRFAYNAGTFDAYNMARNYFKVVSKTGGKNSKKAASLRLKLYRNFGLKENDALLLGQYKNLKSAIKHKNARLKLHDSGVQAANRDALIPQAENRLLFTQSKTPWIRMLGQFLSWAQAKSATANKMIARMEDGDAILLIKTLAAVPVYAGIQQLREFAKTGYITNDWAYNKKELLAKSWQLSGNPGWLSDLIFNRFLGPGSNKKGTNFFIAAPALSMANNFIDLGKTALTGNWKKFWKIIDRKIAPFPDWRGGIQRKWFPRSITSGFSGTNKEGLGLSKGGRVGYEHGDEVILPQEKPTEEIIIPKKKPMNKKDLAAAVVATTLATTGVTADMDKAVANDILPAKKPIVIIEKNYDNLPDLPPVKKKWLTKTAEKVYLTNNNNVIPNDIILAINGGETGWGTSRFWKEGSKNLFNIQSFNDKEKSIPALDSDAKIKVFKTEEDSIKEFLNWIETKDTYAGVREEIKLYNEGEGSKERIIDAIAKTGFAEDDDWSGKIKSILNKRINGKHKKELEALATTLFTGPANKN